MNDIIAEFVTMVFEGRVFQQLESGWIVADARWLLTHGCLFRH